MRMSHKEEKRKEVTTFTLRKSIAKHFITAAADTAEMLEMASVINPTAELEELSSELNEFARMSLEIAAACFDRNYVQDLNAYTLGLTFIDEAVDDDLSYASRDEMQNNKFAQLIVKYHTFRVLVSEHVEKNKDMLTQGFAKSMLEEMEAGRLQVMSLDEFIEEVVNDTDEEK